MQLLAEEVFPLSITVYSSHWRLNFGDYSIRNKGTSIIGFGPTPDSDQASLKLLATVGTTCSSGITWSTDKAQKLEW